MERRDNQSRLRPFCLGQSTGRLHKRCFHHQSPCSRSDLLLKLQGHSLKMCIRDSCCHPAQYRLDNSLWNHSYNLDYVLLADKLYNILYIYVLFIYIFVYSQVDTSIIEIAYNDIEGTHIVMTISSKSSRYTLYRPINCQDLESASLMRYKYQYNRFLL